MVTNPISNLLDDLETSDVKLAALWLINHLYPGKVTNPPFQDITVVESEEHTHGLLTQFLSFNGMDNTPESIDFFVKGWNNRFITTYRYIGPEVCYKGVHVKPNMAIEPTNDYQHYYFPTIDKTFIVREKDLESHGPYDGLLEKTRDNIQTLLEESLPHAVKLIRWASSDIAFHFENLLHGIRALKVIDEELSSPSKLDIFWENGKVLENEGILHEDTFMGFLTVMSLLGYKEEPK